MPIDSWTKRKKFSELASHVSRVWDKLIGRRTKKWEVLALISCVCVCVKINWSTEHDLSFVTCVWYGKKRGEFWAKWRTSGTRTSSEWRTIQQRDQMVYNRNNESNQRISEGEEWSSEDNQRSKNKHINEIAIKINGSTNSEQRVILVFIVYIY